MRFFYYLIFTLILAAAHSDALAQTCRVSVGGTAGKQNYIEVFEYDFVSEKPVYPGGESSIVEFINETRQYPEQAYKAGIEGCVLCSFVVNTDGSVNHVCVLRGIEKSLDREAVRVIGKMREWKPGRHQGKPVPVRMVRSVPFRK